MNIKRKIPSFVFGLSIGLIIGVGIFLFKITDLFDSIKNSSKEKITVIEKPVNNDLKSEQSTKDKDRFKIKLTNSTKINYREVDSLIKQDDNYNVATDEMLSVKSVKLIKISDSKNEHDSLSANVANVSQFSSDIYFVEFWKTPLNSRGYRFTKNKIMLYGFVDYTNVILYQLDNSYYIKCSEQVYKLFSGSEFKQLEKVNDSELLAKMN